ncbi:BglG family transcription antiterminator [Lacrimispora sp.]|uniref:BglG family transcription antiterminator n=1 Tax=Lacrimispora sp. TaxID=2719234 RepID=UPI002FDB029D
MLSDKANRILKILVLNNNEPITVKMLGICLDMSERSVSTYLKEVSDFCEKHHITYVSKRGSGVYLELSEAESCALRNFSEPSYYDAEYRISYIKQILLEGWENYTISLLSEELFTSKYIIGSDLDLAEAWFKEYGLTFIRKSKRKLSIEGNEWNRRRAIISNERSKKNRIKAVSQTEYDKRLDGLSAAMLENYCGSEICKRICQAIGGFEDKAGGRFVDYSFIMLVEYLCVQYERIRTGKHISDQELGGSYPGESASGHMGILISNLESALGVTLGSGERDYLYILLAGAEFQQDEEEKKREFLLVSRQSVHEISGRILMYLSGVSGLKLYQDECLCSGLEFFVHRCMIRTKFGLEICNPFLEEIKKSYSAIFTTCFSLGSYIREDAGNMPSEHEIAFLTLLIGGSIIRMDKKTRAVLIGAGSLLLAEMTAKKIEQRVPWISVIAVLPMDCACQVKQLDCNLVITTIPGYELELPTVYATPVISDRDVLKLQKAVNQLYADRLGHTDPFSLADYFKPEFILLDVESAPKERLIQMGCSILEREHYVTSEYCKEVLRRESISSTEIGNGVAIPHGIENTIRKPAVFIIRLKNKMDWGNGLVDIIFILALNFNDIGVTRKFFNLFYEKAGNEETVELIRTAKTKEKVLSILQ